MESTQEDDEPGTDAHDEVEDEDGEEGGTTKDYMIAFVRSDMEFFGDWRPLGFKG
jgi:helicase SWR1